MATIQVNRLTKECDVRAVDSVSFTVEAGEVFGFLGPNGAGKTTTIRSLLRLIGPSAGSATVLDADIHDEQALLDAKRRIGYLPAHLGFSPKATGEEVLNYHESIKGGSRRKELLEIFTPPCRTPNSRVLHGEQTHAGDRAGVHARPRSDHYGRTHLGA